MTRPRAMHHLVVPPELELTAEQVLAAIQPTNTRLSSATYWHLESDLATTEGLEYSYLQGEEGPQLETKQGFEIEGMAFRLRLDFGAAFLEPRGWLGNIGA